MTITSSEYSDLLHYFSVQNSSNHIISLALTANDSVIVGFKNPQLQLQQPQQQQIISFEQPWNILDTDNSTLFSQYADNASSVQFSTNDTLSNQTIVVTKPRISTEIPIWLIPCYSVILIFAIVGNILVASTLFQNRRMRTITNVFLANLAISDMLLGVLCMPITLVGTYLRHFIFGELVCKFIQFAQAASVAVSSWTLVAISCERYYAICHPLRSRTWQTINHAYKIIGCIWFGSIICMAPIAIFSQLIPTSRQGLRKCREQWPEEAVGYERFYNIFLDLVLLVLPLGILCVAYILITRTLYLGIKDEKALIFGSKNNNMSNNVGDAKIYTQVEADVKTANVFNLHMSFRYHTRKGGVAGGSGSGSSGNGIGSGCISESGGTPAYSNNEEESLQIIKSTTTNNGNGSEAKSYTGDENKYSTMTTASTLAKSTINTRRGLCYDTNNTEAETDISFKEIKEQHNKLQRQSSSVQSHLYDEITPQSSGSDSAAINRRRVMAKSINGRRQQLYCMRSASVRTLYRNTNNTSNSADCGEDTASTSCYSLNTLPTAHSRVQRQRLNQKRQQQPQRTYHQNQLQYHQQQQPPSDVPEKRKLNSMPSLRITESALRRSNIEKNLESKKRVVKMLFVLVLEFFICWTPLYVINTVAMFIGPAIYEYVDYTTISFFQLLAYSSSCCNPITYCFMNAGFRRAFVDTFRGMHLNSGSLWHKSTKTATNLSVAGNSIALANSCTGLTANTVLESPRL